MGGGKTHRFYPALWQETSVLQQMIGFESLGQQCCYGQRPRHGFGTHSPSLGPASWRPPEYSPFDIIDEDGSSCKGYDDHEAIVT